MSSSLQWASASQARQLLRRWRCAARAATARTSCSRQVPLGLAVALEGDVRQLVGFRPTCFMPLAPTLPCQPGLPGALPFALRPPHVALTVLLFQACPKPAAGPAANFCLLPPQWAFHT